ncbi:DUF6602 domain-containing protein [Nocardia gipuzkoensis]|uniref:DUF6602 domain-containing protein n=1 Tax=Nocardia gipuzkoensis TaxID=2749991 RepID=UPI00237E8073|nr:DUF6602 domain-containing protein [Nocardia gipuzkoensis]MDE1673185.1 hypothetical protein [Nocardia gipuzkoensis]
MNGREATRRATKLGDMFRAVEAELLVELGKARVGLNHMGNRGSRVEDAARKALRGVLPRQFDVGHGEVFDRYGDTSSQMDIIVTTLDHPFTHPGHQPMPYMLDGVAAVGEVKTRLTTGELQDCIEKGIRFKRLRRAVGKHDVILNHSEEYLVETQLLPPFFVLAFENDVAIDTVLKRMNEAPLAPVQPTKLNFKEDSPQHPLDAICILGKGLMWNLRSGLGPIQLRHGSGPPLTGWQWVDTDVPFSWMLHWMHIAIPQIQRRHSPLIHYTV